MADNYTPRVKAILTENGCTFVRQGKGDHEIWHSPITMRRLMVDSFIKSRHWANYTLNRVRKNSLTARKLAMLELLSSFPRKRESRHFKGFWIPALRFAAAGMTVF
jgi:hypothetical protein